MTQPKRSIKLMPFDFVRGFLMGLVELVPGVSGGTIALVTGIYDDLIASAVAVPVSYTHLTLPTILRV